MADVKSQNRSSRIFLVTLYSVFGALFFISLATSYYIFVIKKEFITFTDEETVPEATDFIGSFLPVNDLEDAEVVQESLNLEESEVLEEPLESEE